MKPNQIQFFSPQDNLATKTPKTKEKPVKLEGFISNSGKLVFPAKTVEQLGLDTETVRFLIGTSSGKRKIKTLYLVPTQDVNADAFELRKGAKSYTIALSFILQKGGIDYSTSKYRFSLAPFDFEEGQAGYELTLESDTPKASYTGKPRGRKPKATT